jgi:hypothetical protein
MRMRLESRWRRVCVSLTEPARPGRARSPRGSRSGQPATEIGLATQRGKREERNHVRAARGFAVVGDDRKRHRGAVGATGGIPLAPIGGSSRLWCKGPPLSAFAAAGWLRRRRRTAGVRRLTARCGAPSVLTARIAAARIRIPSGAGRAGTLRSDTRQGSRREQDAGDQAKGNGPKHGITRGQIRYALIILPRLSQVNPHRHRSVPSVGDRRKGERPSRQSADRDVRQHSRFGMRAPIARVQSVKRHSAAQRSKEQAASMVAFTVSCRRKVRGPLSTASGGCGVASLVSFSVGSPPLSGTTGVVCGKPHRHPGPHRQPFEVEAE